MHNTYIEEGNSGLRPELLPEGKAMGASALQS
jgi:hypothetical protein